MPLDRALGFVYEDAVATVPECATLVLYSDGAIERRGEPLDVGHGAARERGRGGRAARARRALHALLDALIDDSRGLRDDVALLVARALPPDVAPLQLWFAARAGPARGRARGDADVAGGRRAWRPGDRELVVLAAGELCANAVEHAYPPGSDAAVEVALAREPGGVLTLVVRDRGRWRPPPADPGDRGRGLGIVRALMHTVDVDQGADGTTVSARYRPGAAPPAPAGVGRAAAASRWSSSAACRSRACRARSTAPTRARSSRSCWRSRPGRWSSTCRGWRSSSSAGLAVLFALAKRCVRIAVVAPAGAPFRRALEVAELVRVAHVADSVQLALEHFARP